MGQGGASRGSRTFSGAFRIEGGIEVHVYVLLGRVSYLAFWSIYKIANWLGREAMNRERRRGQCACSLVMGTSGGHGNDTVATAS